MENIKLKPQEIFLEYQNANEYKNSIGDRGIYEQSKMNERFYVGDQWHGVQAGNTRPLVRRNIIKRIGEYKISTLCSNPVTVNYSCEGTPLENTQTELLESVPTGSVTDEEINAVTNERIGIKTIGAQTHEGCCVKSIPKKFKSRFAILS